jgi:hypothetical protein
MDLILLDIENFIPITFVKIIESILKIFTINIYYGTSSQLEVDE